jgi:hypothetical protein
MRKFFETLILSAILFIMGFLAYPLVFVPLGAKLFPEFMDELVALYRIYLTQLWGF